MLKLRGGHICGRLSGGLGLKKPWDSRLVRHETGQRQLTRIHNSLLVVVLTEQLSGVTVVIAHNEPLSSPTIRVPRETTLPRNLGRVVTVENYRLHPLLVLRENDCPGNCAGEPILWGGKP